MERKTLPKLESGIAQSVERRIPNAAVVGSSPAPTAKFRISHPDRHNWILESFKEGGQEISRGKFAGKITKSRWVVLGYYSSLNRAVLGWLYEEVASGLQAEGLQNGYGSAQEVLGALKAVEARVLAAIPQVVPAAPQ